MPDDNEESGDENSFHEAQDMPPDSHNTNTIAAAGGAPSPDPSNDEGEDDDGQERIPSEPQGVEDSEDDAAEIVILAQLRKEQKRVTRRAEIRRLEALKETGYQPAATGDKRPRVDPQQLALERSRDAAKPEHYSG